MRILGTSETLICFYNSQRWKTATTSKLRPRVEYVIPPEVNSVESPYSIEMDGSNCVQTPPPSYPEVASGDSTKF